MADDVRAMVGLNIRRLRIAAGLTQAELAERMGVDRGYVSGLELGQRNPTVVTLWHTAERLGQGFDRFLRKLSPLAGPKPRWAVRKRAECPR
jgi:transcriptional regulator with XRE-family HTH domain